MKKRSAKAQTDGQVLIDHIRELRTRLVVCAVVLVVGGIVGYMFYTPILEWLRSPLGADLYYSTPAGSFNFILKVSSMIGILAAVPFFIFQLIMFVQPVFKERLSGIRVIGYTFASILLAVVGALFAFYVILPGALRFFAGFQVAGLSALIDANNYLNFVINAIVTFIIVFQIPLVMVIIDRIKPISPKKLLAAEKYVIVGGLVVSLLVPFALDITTSLLIASPIVILYNLSVAMIVLRHLVQRHQRTHAATEKRRAKRKLDSREKAIEEFFEEDIAVEDEPLVSAPVQVPEVLAPVVKRNVGKPLHVKPLPGEVKIAQLRAEAQAKRQQEIAARVAKYNSRSSKTIRDFR